MQKAMKNKKNYAKGILPNDVDCLNMSSENFKEELGFALWSMGSSSDYRNDRERPYNGQSHTSEGIRGKQEVKGLTMRDLTDCMVKAMLISSPDHAALSTEEGEFLKCWDFSECKPENEEQDAKPRQYLLDKIAEGKYVGDKVAIGNWRTQDVYKIDWNNIDPVAILQNFGCEVEKMMGIFPNIDKLEHGTK